MLGHDLGAPGDLHPRQLDRSLRGLGRLKAGYIGEVLQRARFPLPSGYGRRRLTCREAWLLGQLGFRSFIFAALRNSRVGDRLRQRRCKRDTVSLMNFGSGFWSFGLLVNRSNVVRFPLCNRDLEIIRVDLAEGEEAVSIVAVVYECGLERRLDAGNFGEINVTFYLLLGRRFEIEFFETVTVEHHHPRLFRVSGIDEHAFCHSGITPGRAAPAARKSAGGAILCARKPPAPGAIPPCNEGASVMGGLVRGALIGFGFLRSVSPGVATRRDGSRAVDLAGVRRIDPPGAAPGWRTAVFRDPYCID